MKNFYSSLPIRPILIWVALTGAILPALSQEEFVPPPVQPKPVEEWRPPQVPPNAPRIVVPDLPPARETQPLSGRPVQEAPPPPVRNDPLRQIPEEPPVEEEDSSAWEVLLSQTIRPVVLPPPNRLTVIRDGVILREGPGLDFPSLGTLQRGGSIRRLDTDDDWHRVAIGSGTEGWVYSELTQAVQDFPAIVAGDRVNLRAQPSADGLVLGSLYQGAVVMAGDRSGEWTRIRTPNIEEAYVSGPYIRNLPPKYPPNFPLREVALSGDKPFASLAVVEETTAETAYLLAVWGDEWVKGGKVGLLFLSAREKEPEPVSEPATPVFTEGTFFEATVQRDDFEKSFATTVALPKETLSATVAYLRGTKKDRIWLFEFAIGESHAGGKFAMVCQEGPQTGAYLLLQERRSEDTP